MRALAVAVALSSATAVGAAPIDLTIPTADGPRHALLVVAADGPQPTVLVLHGALGTAAQTLRAAGFAEAAARHGLNAVFPDGVDRQWHDGRAGLTGTIDDVAFLRALVERLVADRVAQPDAVFIAGISNGGMMSLTMACRASNLFAGLGTVIANLPAGIGPCDLKPMPVVMINGTADPVMPYGGGVVGFKGRRGSVESVAATLALFAKVDGCSGPSAAVAITQKDPSAGTRAFRIDWQGCAPGTSLTAYRVDGGGHALPGRPAFGLGSRLGLVNQDFSGADVILDAFARGR